VRIDLHCHSTVSDGTDSPAQLVATAAANGLDVVAITDHDTTAGWQEAEDALPPGLTLVRGAEFSAMSPDGHGGYCLVHLLAYLFDPESPAIVAEHARLRADRRRRVRIIAERLADAGLPIDPPKFMETLPEHGTVGRPHIAQALVKVGLVSTVDEAFAKYLNTIPGPAGREPANIHRERIVRKDTLIHDAIDMVTQAGGVTVLAHSFAHQRGPTITGGVIADLAQHGLTGLEIDHPDHGPEERRQLTHLARDLGLLVTGSSDYHGTNKTVRIGQETTDPDMFETLIGKATGVSVVTG
jgi:predicted metal-dependent phosphoesterase TrpH